MNPELFLLVGILFFASGFFEKERIQRVSSFVGGLFIAAIGMIGLVFKDEGFTSLNLLGGLAILGLLAWLMVARWSARSASISSPSEFHRIRQRAIGFLLAAAALLVLGIVKNNLTESLLGVAICVLFALWDIFNTRKRAPSDKVT